MAKKAKPRRLSTSEGGPQHQDHVKMNICILEDVIIMQRRKDQKIDSCARAKAPCEWDKLVIVAEQCPPLPKPTLVKLASKQLL